ncbi:MAG TPA: type IV secretion protein IcmO, partial [Alphaproteobacteria bacterium]|nr:type IV secretion protein IcmO [Alphaproteobacteria bacterium]
MALDSKYELAHKSLLRDSRPLGVRISSWLERPSHSFTIFFLMGMGFHYNATMTQWADIVLLLGFLYLIWLRGRDKSLAFKLPLGAKYKDKNSRSHEAEGILYLG